MYTTPKYFEQHKQLFQKMSPEQLSLYCQEHPRYSLPAGIRDQRMKESFEIMTDSAKDLAQRDRQILSVYVQETFARGYTDVRPHMLHTLYAPVLTDPNFEKAPLQKAIDEFLGFARTPMTKERHTLLKQFVKQIETMPRTATAFEKGMEAYRQRTVLFPHETITGP